ncbi:MAG: succinylglutamate desuccinylase/aspartoacylase family protein [Burkholderiaceae bacterium]|nr:succinylglutamate desuccinylase/aspartoacylase family protein [Rhodoferax sp.]MCB2028139.1 succinylglutamate desuccinylase/aspartoacylase family protein [Rhodoferax sp.]MCP5264163.1 succinylglutamate desuccinylase/aspartoacylase family protein [Rhodoferax sp.]MCW5644397.1 succinylglutamate desuccinylase/aspartoacylase family protein [Rhodoferax sp.]
MPDDSSTFEVLPRDLSAYRSGNTGIDYVHRFDSGVAGPHVMINALTHGNEFCGMVAACHLLDTGVRPKIGTLTVSFANVAAYESFDPADPFASRQITHNLNRIWSDDWLDGDEHSVELQRARVMRPAVAAADHILDIHSTSQDVVPFWVYPHFERNSAVANALPRPGVHLVMPRGLGSGTPLIQHGRHGHADGPGAAMVVECGQHFKQASADLAVAVTYDFLGHFGLLERAPVDTTPPRRFELLRTHVIATEAFAFTRPVVGFETFAKDALIATDGDLEIRAPCDDCTIFMPARVAIVGREGVYLTRPLD